MGFRFQKPIGIFKGLMLNLTKSGSPQTVGRPGASVNFRGDKVSGNVGISGSGISYRETLSHDDDFTSRRKAGSPDRVFFWTVLLIVLEYLYMR
jgi:hypothetical protein